MKLAISAVLFSIVLAAPLAGQAAPSAGSDAPPAGMHPGGPHRPHGFGMFGPGMATHRIETVTGLPVQAQFTVAGNFTDRAGATVERTATSMIYRDSQGRVREETTLPQPPPRNPAAETRSAAGPETSAAPRGPRTLVTIVDPVAHTITHLNADRQTASVQTVPAEFFTHMQQREDRRHSAGAQPGRDGAATTTSLGSKTFAGVSATGEQAIITFPAHDGGAAHTLTHQTWFSPDLKMMVSSLEATDRGTRTETLTSLSRTEPDPSLFQVPAGYTVTDASEHHFPGGHHGGPGGPRNSGDADSAPPPPPSM